VWRLTALTGLAGGPFDAMTNLRRALVRRGIRAVLCFHCTAIWLALLVAAVFYEWRWPTLAIALALAGGASMTERFLGGSAGFNQGEEHD
jgi:hypothetical protein